MGVHSVRTWSRAGCWCRTRCGAGDNRKPDSSALLDGFAGLSEMAGQKLRFRLFRRALHSADVFFHDERVYLAALQRDWSLAEIPARCFHGLPSARYRRTRDAHCKVGDLFQQAWAGIRIPIFSDCLPSLLCHPFGNALLAEFRAMLFGKLPHFFAGHFVRKFKRPKLLPEINDRPTPCLGCPS